MKNILKSQLCFFLLIFCLSFATTLPAQNPPPPPAEHGTTGNQAPGGGGGAPIDGGLLVSLAMVAGFGAWKLYKSMQKKKEVIEN